MHFSSKHTELDSTSLSSVSGMSFCGKPLLRWSTAPCSDFWPLRIQPPRIVCLACLPGGNSTWVQVWSLKQGSMALSDRFRFPWFSGRRVPELKVAFYLRFASHRCTFQEVTLVLIQHHCSLFLECPFAAPCSFFWPLRIQPPRIAGPPGDKSTRVPVCSLKQKAMAHSDGFEIQWF